METLELIHIDNSDYRAIVNLIDRMTEGENGYRFSVNYKIGYVDLEVAGTVYREFTTEIGTSLGSYNERLKSCNHMSVVLDYADAIDEDGEYVECDFDIEKLKRYLN